MPLLPVADVLLIERRICKCGTTVEVHSPFRYRLFKACQGEPDKTEIRKLKDFPEKADEMDDLRPLPDRCIAHHDIHTPWCAACFAATMPMAEARLIRPPSPVQHYTVMQTAWTRAQSAASGKAAKVRPLTLEEL